ncbi:hypothetical protein KIW84_041797 [Lathyrus oleraceus]|uniref:Uncharacterized protein n=1 Tax=Pisum sativum TaxID=3888 RepID=A0A9D5APS9_PEA|nr:hypothetical protein KIW84_041797 [Pisum sativum]
MDNKGVVVTEKSNVKKKSTSKRKIASTEEIVKDDMEENLNNILAHINNCSSIITSRAMLIYQIGTMVAFDFDDEDVVGVVGSHVPDILVSNINFDMTAEGELSQVPPLSSSSRSHVLLEFMEVSKTLQEVITTSTFHKNKVDEMIKIMVSKGVELPLPRLLKRIMGEMFEDNEDI